MLPKGIHPTENHWLSAKVDELISGCTDVTATIGTTFRIQDANEKIAARKALVDKDEGRLHMHLNGLEQICAANQQQQQQQQQQSMSVSSESDGYNYYYSVGSSITVADLAVWRLIGWIDSGTLDGIPVNYVVDTFPALRKLVQTVDSHPKVVEWKAKHSKLYSTRSSSSS